MPWALTAPDVSRIAWNYILVLASVLARPSTITEVDGSRVSSTGTCREFWSEAGKLYFFERDRNLLGIVISFSRYLVYISIILSYVFADKAVVSSEIYHIICLSPNNVFMISDSVWYYWRRKIDFFICRKIW